MYFSYFKNSPISLSQPTPQSRELSLDCPLLQSSVSAAPWLCAVLTTALKITNNFCDAKFPGYFSPASDTVDLFPSLKPTPLSALMIIMHSPRYSFLTFILYLYLTYQHWISSSLVQGIFFLLILLWNLTHSLKHNDICWWSSNFYL